MDSTVISNDSPTNDVREPDFGLGGPIGHDTVVQEDDPVCIVGMGTFLFGILKLCASYLLALFEQRVGFLAISSPHQIFGAFYCRTSRLTVASPLIASYQMASILAHRIVQES